MKNKILTKKFYARDCLEVAPDLVGKLIVRIHENGTRTVLRITETEAYRGEEDTACHASKGRTGRTEVMYGEAGHLYVYLCYGMHWLMNVVTGKKDQPQAVLIRACKNYDGPGKLTKQLSVDKSFNCVSLIGDPRIHIEDDGFRPDIETLPRVGINYATPEYRDILWRFADKERNKKE